MGELVRLENWYLNYYGKNVMAWGTCFGHEKLPDGLFVHTNVIMEAEVAGEPDMLKMRTKSGTLYELAVSCVNIEGECLEKTKECLASLNIPASFLDKAEILVKEREAQELEEADQLTEDGDLFLKVAGSNVVKAYFKHEGRIYVPSILVHVGMFQDSVLIRHYNIVDYRYFPEFFALSTYHMSDSIKHLVIKNIGEREIRVDRRNYSPGTIERVPITKDYYREGLLSPDCVNGKNLLEGLCGDGKKDDKM